MDAAVLVTAGELLADRPELRVALLEDADALGVSHTVLSAGSGWLPPPHVHLRRARVAVDLVPPDEAWVDPVAAVVNRLGGSDVDRPNRRVTLLADTEIHVHRELTDVWLVLVGTLTFELRGGRELGRRVPPTSPTASRTTAGSRRAT